MVGKRKLCFSISIYSLNHDNCDIIVEVTETGKKDVCTNCKIFLDNREGKLCIKDDLIVSLNKN